MTRLFSKNILLFFRTMYCYSSTIVCNVIHCLIADEEKIEKTSHLEEILNIFLSGVLSVYEDICCLYVSFKNLDWDYERSTYKYHAILFLIKGILMYLLCVSFPLTNTGEVFKRNNPPFCYIYGSSSRRQQIWSCYNTKNFCF